MRQRRTWRWGRRKSSGGRIRRSAGDDRRSPRNGPSSARGILRRDDKTDPLAHVGGLEPVTGGGGTLDPDATQPRGRAALPPVREPHRPHSSPGASAAPEDLRCLHDADDLRSRGVVGLALRSAFRDGRAAAPQREADDDERGDKWKPSGSRAWAAADVHREKRFHSPGRTRTPRPRNRRTIPHVRRKA